MRNSNNALSEDTEQTIVFNWANLMANKHPELEYMFHVPNGGKRSKSEAVRFKHQGVKAGVPDIFLPIPNKTFNGLFIELKAKGGKLSEHQKKWLLFLNSQNYCAVCCYGADEAIATIEKYLSEK